LVILLTGAGVGLCGLLAFGTVHALLIVPIWTRLLGGAPFALAAGMALAWAFEELNRTRGWHSPLDGVRFGALMFSTLAPATAFDTALRLSGADRTATLITVVEVTMAAAAGAATGPLLARTHRSAFAVAALALMLVSAGPLPFAQSARGARLVIAIAPICMLAGATLAVLRRLLNQRMSS
jgi:hypothetical protein